MQPQVLQSADESLQALRPRLSPAVSVVRNGEDTCYLMMSGRELLRCQGPLVSVLVEQLLPLLDGTRTVGEIRDALSGRLDAKSVEGLLRQLLQHRVLIDEGPARALPAHERAEFGDLLAFLARSSSEPYRLLERLRQMRLVVLGDSELARDVVVALVECAIGTIDLLLPEEMSAVVEGRLPARVRHFPLGQVREVIPGADLIIGVQDGEFSFTRQLRELNRLCLQQGASWLQLRLTLEAEGWLGPLHAPGTACFECMDARLKSHLQARKEHGLHEQQVERGLLLGRRMGFGPIRRQLAGAVAVELLLHLTGIEPSRLVGRSLLIDTLSQESSLHPVLKHPNCPACGGTPADRPSPWSAETIRLERTLLKGPTRP